MKARSLRTTVTLAVVALTSSSCGTPAEEVAASAGEVAVNVRTLELAPTTLRETLTVTGPLQPIRGTTISAEESGVVATVARDKGATIGRGDVLLELKRDLLEAEMQSASATQQLKKYNEDRTRQLFEANQVSRFEMLQIETERSQAEAQADIARLRYERAAVKAPFAGIVADRYVEPGQLVPAGSAVARVVDPSTLKLRASVSEREVGWISVGAPARISVDGVGSRAGEVRWVSYEADPVNGTVQVESHLDNADAAFRAGVVARAEIVKRVHEGAIVIPRDAILFATDGSAVFTVDGDRARSRRVDLGEDQGLLVRVRSGLEAGEQLVVRGQRDLTDGSLVAVRERATSSDGAAEGDPRETRSPEHDGGAPAATGAEGSGH
jgi:membrane fusion protein (multidrug efflux system)